VIAFFTILQLRNDPFSLLLEAPLPIEGSDNADKILDQVFLTVFGKVGHLDLTVLHGQRLLDIVEPKAGLAVFVFNIDQADGWIGQQLQDLWTGVVDHGGDLVAFRRARVHHPFGLLLEVGFVLCCGDSGVDHSPRVMGGKIGLERWLCHGDGVSISLKAGDLSSLEPAPGGRIRDTMF
jgi:hypothetical protein